MDHVVLESECIDRMYLNAYVPQLQRVGGVVWYLRGHLGQRFVAHRHVEQFRSSATLVETHRHGDELAFEAARHEALLVRRLFTRQPPIAHNVHGIHAIFGQPIRPCR